MGITSPSHRGIQGEPFVGAAHLELSSVSPQAIHVSAFREVHGGSRWLIRYTKDRETEGRILGWLAKTAMKVETAWARVPAPVSNSYRDEAVLVHDSPLFSVGRGPGEGEAL
jgi:hypothetical protein